MIDKKNLKEYAGKLMFDMKEEEYETLEKEFEIILKQMDLLEKIEGIHEIEPMTFPFQIKGVELREDKVKDSLSTEKALFNSKIVQDNQVKVPKVVES